MTREDSDVLNKTASGDHEAFRILFMKYFPRVKYFIANMVKSEHTAEDLSQDIFSKVWLSRETLPELRSFNAFIYRMARNAALNHLEHKCVMDSHTCRHASMSEQATPEDIFCAHETELLVSIAVDRMPEQRRKIYIQSRLEGVSNGDIAGNLGISEKTVRNQLSLALKEIRSVLSSILMFFL